ncbi:hypothetical protein Pmar_PMAR003126 [Perkinsus marinus ATCC 50983]|uniref:Uncharacterized protein n=1 Tax=Perkinsus marinus (strain ATCC 50983 / TXsc) TaxID=423536 RepID=C5L2Z1_PERM5|nr:hypothetical protein Pmar_PMAR003126 [Perkinsus marinus ATCC 50983]EER08878.1 hypothetical protein Pmar_PMAR003126 [Perkinsus marinus ATCC 50983]|eukprot:XP_002777062.1 hypothetical protein Pmar_PMAR003126 [Perkinsus marinus ATCC 50983]
MSVPWSGSVIICLLLSHLVPAQQTCIETTPPPSAQVDCSNAKLGFYVWPQSLWMDPSNREFIDFVAHPAVRSLSCGGDLWFNIGDYSNVGKIKNTYRLFPFIQELRSSIRPGTQRSSRGVIYLAYADFTAHDELALLEFIDTFFEWLLSLTPGEILEVAPIGISLDVEASPSEMVFNTLVKLRAYKYTYLTDIPEDAFLIQHVVSGFPSPQTTKYVMELADSALFLVYRSYMYDTSSMNLLPGNNLLGRFRWFITQQCEDCLSPGYQPRAKITVLVEADCNVYEYCGLISFCAQNDGGISNVVSTLEVFWSELTISGLLTQERFDALMNKNSPYGIHNW